MVVMVDKMLKTQIVECSSVANWIFCKNMNKDLTFFYVWEILHSTVSRMSKQVEKLHHEYTEMDQKFKKSSIDDLSNSVNIYTYFFMKLINLNLILN